MVVGLEGSEQGEVVEEGQGEQLKEGGGEGRGKKWARCRGR